MAFGFSEKDVVSAMREFAGDMDAALNHLLEAVSSGVISIHPWLFILDLNVQTRLRCGFLKCQFLEFQLLQYRQVS